MKQKTLQRFIYKIKSEDIRAAGWEYVYPNNVRDGIASRDIITISSSQVIRFIDELVGRQDVDSRAREIRGQIKQLAAGKVIRGYKQKIKELYSELHSLQVIPEYLCVVIKNKADYRRLNKGFKFNGRKYVRLLSTNGGLKDSVIIYSTEDVVNAGLRERLACGCNGDLRLIPAKYESYRGLSCSTSTPVSLPHGIVVVHDAYTAIREDVILLKDGEGEPTMTREKGFQIRQNANDGYGLATPELMARWQLELEEHRPLSGVCIRNAFCKGMIFPFDFQEFAHNIAKTSQITDVWGNSYDIDKIELILTESMLKLWNGYDSIEDYLGKCEKYHYTFAITKLYTDEIDREKRLNYQFIQTLNLSTADIDSLLCPAVRDVEDICGGNEAKMLLYLCGMGLNERNYFAGRENWQRALMLNPEMINDPFILGKVEKMISKRMDELKFGRIPVSGNFQVMSGDPYALCESMFGMEVHGLLGAGEYYSSYWIGENVNQVAVFRAPMSCHNNIRLGNINSDECARYWYRWMKNIFILNAWDTTMQALNGCDFDGDLCFSTDNSVIINGVCPQEAVICQQKTAEKVVVTENDIVESNILAFGNKIGQITNRVTAMIDLQSGFEKNSLEYQTLAYRIICGQLYQQNEIDKFKGIITKEMPKKWYSPDACENDFERSICASRRPYFMVYTRDEYMATFKNYEKTRNATCERMFGKEISQLDDEGAEGAFLASYREHYPVLTGNGVMNRICRRAEELIAQCEISIKGRKPFSYDILKNGVNYRPQMKADIRTIYQNYMKDYRTVCKSSDYAGDERAPILSALTEWYRAAMIEVVPDENVLCEILIDIAYTTQHSKQVVWSIVGDEMVLRLMELYPQIVLPMRCDDGDVLYHGQRFKMKEVNLDGEYQCLDYCGGNGDN